MEVIPGRRERVALVLGLGELLFFFGGEQMWDSFLISFSELAVAFGRVNMFVLFFLRC